MQDAVVILVVGLAALYVVRRAWRTFSGRSDGCGCGRSSCPCMSPQLEINRADERPVRP